MSMITSRRNLLGAATLLATPAIVTAQPAWPVRPIRMVVPFAAGGGTDVLSRIYAQRMTELLGQPVLIDNRGGSGGNIGAEMVVRAPPDGYTLMITSNGPSTVNRFLYKDMSFDPIKDLMPIGLVFRIEQLLIIYPGLPVTTVAEFIAMAKAKPGEVNFGSGGSGSSLHLAGELFKLRARVNLTHVPYRGGGPAMADLTAGNIQAVFDSMPSALPQVRGGRVRALAMCGLKRHPLLPEVPTMQEAGVEGYNAGTWIATFAPLGTPASVLEKFAATSRAALAEPALRDALARAGGDAESSTAQELTDLMVRETAQWGEVVREAGIVAN
jgi:tripartite-type tricarboxylate transporter receptor subunit TctC